MPYFQKKKKLRQRLWYLDANAESIMSNTDILL